MDYALTQVPGVVRGEIVGLAENGRPLVMVSGDEDPRPATVAWMPLRPDWRASMGLPVLLAFIDGDQGCPVIIALLGDPRLEQTKTPKMLVVESERELLIQCGKSKIALRADGRIEIRGGHVVSRSSGPNKIKGGSVHIN